MAIVKAARANNLPDGVFSLLFDTGFSIGKALVEHPLTAAVGFTGSAAGGRALFDLACARPKPIPVFSEMGSINPSVLLPEALQNRAEEIANNYAGSITLGVGQFCTNPGLILGIKGAGLNNFIKHLEEGIATSPSGTMLHSGISQAYRTKSEEMAQQHGVEFIRQAKEEANNASARPTLAKAPGAEFIANPKLHEEVFGPFSLIIECEDAVELAACVARLEGQLTTTITGEEDEFAEYEEILTDLREKAGRIIFNGVPTGVEVCPAMLHGGPYPATTDSRFTAVGIHSIKRFLRPVSFQDAPQAILPEPLRNENPGQIWRLINGEQTRQEVK
jgi:NADP-dependent aldehyde dehydrogenase